MLTPIEQRTVPGPRFAREAGVTGNGLVDGYDAVLAEDGPRFGTLIDLRA